MERQTPVNSLHVIVDFSFAIFFHLVYDQNKTVLPETNLIRTLSADFKNETNVISELVLQHFMNETGKVFILYVTRNC